MRSDTRLELQEYMQIEGLCEADVFTIETTTSIAGAFFENAASWVRGILTKPVQRPA